MRREFRHQDFVEQGILLVDEHCRARADCLELLLCRHAVRLRLIGAGLDELLEAGDTNLEELIEIRARNAQEFDAFEQRDSAVLGLFQYALVELQEGQLAIDVELRGLQIGVVHDGRTDSVRRANHANAIASILVPEMRPR